MTRRDRPRVLALLHLPPPAHGPALQSQRMLEGGVPVATELAVIRYRFARTVEELGPVTPRKLALGLVYLVRQVLHCLVRRPDAGYLTATTNGAGLIRDALHMNVFRLFGVPYVVRVPAVGMPAEVGRLTGVRRRLVRSALDGVAAVVALDRVHARELARLVPPERVVVVPNGLHDLPPGHRPTPGGIGILFLSNMIREKGPFDVLEALPRIAEAVPDVHATFAGGWPEPALRGEFLARARELGVEERVTIAGVVGEAEKRALMDRAGALVFPTRYPLECSPNVIVEAMRHGLPIVATRHAGIPELVEDGRSALLVPTGDVEALAEAAARVLREPALASRLGRAARAAYEVTHRQERWDERIAGLLRRVAAGEPAND